MYLKSHHIFLKNLIRQSELDCPLSPLSEEICVSFLLLTDYIATTLNETNDLAKVIYNCKTA